MRGGSAGCSGSGREAAACSAAPTRRGRAGLWAYARGVDARAEPERVGAEARPRPASSAFPTEVPELERPPSVASCGCFELGGPAG
jgi:hypothetical protein